MFVSHNTLNDWHLMTSFCQRGEYRKRRLLAEEEAQVGAEAEITAYGIIEERHRRYEIADLNSESYIFYCTSAMTFCG